MKTTITSLTLTLTLTATLALCSGLAHAGDFVIQGDTVFDRDTELTWKRCSVGMRWAADQNRCVGVKQEMSFDEAQQIKAEGGWRVPRIGELKTLIVEQDKKYMQANTNAFPDLVTGHRSYWSSTPSGAFNGSGVDFNDGYTFNYYRSRSFAIRLVRGGQ